MVLSGGGHFGLEDVGGPNQQQQNQPQQNHQEAGVEAPQEDGVALIMADPMKIGSWRKL